MDDKIKIEHTLRLEKTYGSIEEMPPDVRRMYERALQEAKSDKPAMPSHARNATSQRIVIDGTAYHSPAEMPDDVRKIYERMFKKLEESPTNSDITRSKRIVIDGKEYADIDEMPPDVRRQYDEMIAPMDEFAAAHDDMSLPEVVFEGKAYATIDEMPPTVRKNYCEALAAFKSASPSRPDGRDLLKKREFGDEHGVPIHELERTTTAAQHESDESDGSEDSDWRSKAMLIAGIVVVIGLMAIFAWLNR